MTANCRVKYGVEIIPSVSETKYGGTRTGMDTLTNRNMTSKWVDGPTKDNTVFCEEKWTQFLETLFLCEIKLQRDFMFH